MTVPISNLMLDRFPPELRGRIVTAAEPVNLPIRTSFFTPGSPPKYVHFITSGIASIVASMSTGDGVEVGLVGREGEPEALHLLGPSPGITDCFVQVAATALRLDFKRFEQEFFGHEPVRRAMLWSVAAVVVFASATMDAQTGDTLAKFLQALPATVGTSSLDMVASSQMIAIVAQRDAADVAIALPALSKDLIDPDWRVKMVSMVVLRALAERPDSAVLLAPTLHALPPLLKDQHKEVRTFIPVIAEHLRPSAPDDIVKSLREYLATKGLTGTEGTGIAAALAHMRPNDPVTDASISTYIDSQQGDPSSQADVLEAIAFDGLSDVLTGKIVGIFHSAGSERVKQASITALQHIGARAVSQVRPDLETVTNSSKEPLTTRRAASQALRTLSNVQSW